MGGGGPFGEKADMTIVSRLLGGVGGCVPDGLSISITQPTLRGPDMSTERWGFAVAFLNSELWAVGGPTVGDASKSCERLDALTGTWVPLDPSCRPEITMPNALLSFVGSYGSSAALMSMAHRPRVNASTRRATNGSQDLP